MRSGVPLVVSLRRSPPDDSIFANVSKLQSLNVCAEKEEGCSQCEPEEGFSQHRQRSLLLIYVDTDPSVRMYVVFGRVIRVIAVKSQLECLMERL